MWGKFSRHWRVVAAVLFSVITIAGAYVIARGINSPQVAQASSETALLQAIAAKDSDNDGLPDWEEALYGTDPHNPDTFHLGMTDGEAVAKGLIVPKAAANVSSPATSTSATTITDSFARSFFALYLVAKQANGGAEFTSDQASALANQAMNQISPSAVPEGGAKTVADITVSGTGPAALRAFAVSAEAVFKKNMSKTPLDEMQSLQDAVQNEDTGALSQLGLASQIYKNYADGLLAIPVPQELIADDLTLINTMLLRSQADDDFTRVDTDPLAAMLALQQFSQTESSFWNAFSDISQVYASAGVALSKGAPGAAFVNLIANSKATP